ncbi:helix-turn-helix transcriptional regulator [Candidatus Fermentibacterales bacterium]|nr:helix-turn-helix transcriptional regulator [Candidatus Fermentibacterales bacterium]
MTGRAWGRGCRHGPRGHGWDQPQARRVSGFLEPVLLLLLGKGETHGYQLAEGIGEFGLQELSSFDMSTIYRVLRSMEDQGLVRSRWDTETPGPARRLYTITESGSAALDAWAADLRTTRNLLDSFLERLDGEGAGSSGSHGKG